MASAKNKQLLVDREALGTLSLIKEGILSPITKLMNKNEMDEINKSGLYNDKHFPLSIVFAPNGRKNQEILLHAKKGETLDIFSNGLKKGKIVVDEVFKVDQLERISKFFNDTNPNTNPSLKYLLKRLGNIAVCGEFDVEFDEIKEIKNKIQTIKQELDAKTVSAIMMVANPFHRAHERLLRTTMEQSDLVIIFLLKHSSKKELLPFEIRQQTLEHFTENYVHKKRVLIVPFDSSYIFSYFKNAVLDCMIAKNFGCDRIIFGEYYDGIGMYFDSNETRTVLEDYDDFPQISIISEFLYCNECKTLISDKTCPHGRHHHIKYNSASLVALLKSGIMPPAILMRKDISAILLSALFPNRFENVTEIYHDLFPGTGLIETHNDKDFYLELMNLYQTTSLT